VNSAAQSARWDDAVFIADYIAISVLFALALWAGAEWNSLRELPPLAATLFNRKSMNTEKFEGHHEGWRTLWLAIAGVMAITLTWNVLMLSLNSMSYWVATNKSATGKKKATKLVALVIRAMLQKLRLSGRAQAEIWW
jgi:hypothetical protein